MKKMIVLTATGISILLFSACKNNTGTASVAETSKTNQVKAKVTTSQNGSGSFTSATTNTAQVQKKKGWSKAAKYSVGGAAGGMVLGAVINKKDPVRGALAGAVILGGGGYIYGRSQDKKDGRVK